MENKTVEQCVCVIGYFSPQCPYATEQQKRHWVFTKDEPARPLTLEGDYIPTYD